MLQKQNNEKVFHVKKREPKENFTKIPNSFIDETVLYLTPVEMKLLLIFMRSKDTYGFTMPKLAKRLGTNRENLYKVIKHLKEKGLLWKHKDGFELNPNPPINDLKIAKSTERINRIKGKEKAKNTIKERQIQNANISVVDSTTPTVVKDTTPFLEKKSSAVVNSITPAVVEDTTLKNERNPLLVDDTDGQPHRNKTIGNKTNRNIINGNEISIEENSDNLVGGNSLEVILQNPQFNEIYSYNLTSHWENTDISTGYFGDIDPPFRSY